jgi:catalase
MSTDKKLTTNAGCPVAHTARSLGGAPRAIKVRHIGHCLKADPAYGQGVAEALKIPWSDVPMTAAAAIR